MTSLGVEAEHSFTSLPTSDSHRIAHSHWIRQTGSSRDETLTDTLQELRQENVKLSQSLQRKEKHLHAAQQRVEELKQEVKRARDVTGRMQNWEGRLAACGQDSENPRNVVSDQRCVQTRAFKQKKQKTFLDSGGRFSQRIGRQIFPQIGSPRIRHGNGRWSKSHKRRSASSVDEAELCARFEQIALSHSGEN
ncbi:hypothetical protein N7504_007777 [Penicillium tannophilum]|nr:hypothetical protein N7504_007777 [Penicillium tannophilum]